MTECEEAWMEREGSSRETQGGESAREGEVGGQGEKRIRDGEGSAEAPRRVRTRSIGKSSGEAGEGAGGGAVSGQMSRSGGKEMEGAEGRGVGDRQSKRSRDGEEEEGGRRQARADEAGRATRVTRSSAARVTEGAGEDGKGKGGVGVAARQMSGSMQVGSRVGDEEVEVQKRARTVVDGEERAGLASDAARKEAERRSGKRAAAGKGKSAAQAPGATGCGDAGKGAQPNFDSSDDEVVEQRSATSAGAASSSANKKRTRSGAERSSSTPQQGREEQVGDGDVSEQSFVPLSHSRERRSTKPVERLGGVADTPKRRPGGTGKRKPADLVIHMERAGAHGGELKYLIRAGQMLLRCIEKEANGETADLQRRRRR